MKSGVVAGGSRRAYLHHEIGRLVHFLDEVAVAGVDVVRVHPEGDHAIGLDVCLDAILVSVIDGAVAVHQRAGRASEEGVEQFYDGEEEGMLEHGIGHIVV